MRRMFLYGGFADNFEAIHAPFVAAAGGAHARIALLFPPDSERFLDRYCEPWRRLGAGEIVPILPTRDQLEPEALAAIERCNAIYMGGGDTRVYHKLYATGQARELIRHMYAAGVPYGGVSAGALVTPAVCSIWGDRLTTEANRLTLRGSEDGCDAELQLGEGLGLLSGCLTEAHFAELGSFPRLVAAMEQSGVALGLGFDDPICLEIRDEREGLVHGQGRAYILRQQGARRLAVEVLEPGDGFSLAWS